MLCREDVDFQDLPHDLPRPSFFRFVPLFLVFAVCAWPAPGAVITGLCYTDHIENPVGGALVALYGADNLLRSSTFSTDSGTFTMAAPDTSGKYFLVATSGSRSKRVDFDFQQGQPARIVQIVFHDKRNSLVEYLKYAAGKLDYVITTVLGFLIGLWTKKWDNQRLLRIHRVRMAAARDDVVSESESLTGVLNDWLKTAPDSPRREELRTNWQVHISALKRALDDLDAARPDATVVYAVKGEKGFEELRGLKAAIEQLRSLPQRLDTVGNLSADDRNAQLKPFSDLAANPLLKA